jgi:hypothetical protein
MVDGLIIDNDNDWNVDKARANKRYEFVKSRFRNYNRRSENINIQIRCGISMCERKMENEEFIKKNENFLSDIRFSEWMTPNN